MTQEAAIELMQPNSWTWQDIRWSIGKILGKPFNDRTFRYWKQQLGIKAQQGNLYTDEDYKLLLQLAKKRKQGMTIDGFKSLYLDSTPQNTKAKQANGEQQDSRQAQQYTQQSWQQWTAPTEYGESDLSGFDGWT